MTRSRARPITNRRTTRIDSRRITGLVIEIAWLAGIVLVPLLFNPRNWLSFYNDPKYVALHVVALVIIVAWAWERALYVQPGGLPTLTKAREWMGRRPERWTLIAAGGLAVSAVISTIASPVRTTSLWGRDFTDLGYELYSFLSLLVVFVAVAMRVRTESQVRRLMLVFAAVGTVVALYGIGQRHGWDPIGQGDESSRIYASFGNPILLGSFLVMTAVLTPAVALVEERRGRYLWFVLGAVALGIQLAALWYTGSRGPWIGYAIGVAGFTSVGFVWLNRQTLGKGLAMITAGAVVATLIAQIPGGDGNTGRDLGDLGSIFQETSSGSIGGRGPIWGSALELSATRISSPEESAPLVVARGLVGYGPEMSFYAYPLGIEVDRNISFAQHAHNFPLHLLMEMGLLGFTSLLALAVLTIYAGVRMLSVLKKSEEDVAWMSILLVGLLAALAGRAAEQMAGVARVGDLLTFWVLLGVLIAVIEISRARATGPDNMAGAARGSSVKTARSKPADVNYRFLAISVAMTVSVIAATLIYFRDVRTIQASVIAQDAAELHQKGQANAALAKYQRATELAPDVEQYHLTVNDLYRKAADEAESVGNTDLAIFGWESAWAAVQEYEDRNPKAFNTQARLAQAESRLVGLGRDDLVQAATARYEAFAAARPPFAFIQTEAAQGLLAVGDDLLGLIYADRALEMETPAFPNHAAWWFRGVALENLGELEAAAVSYETAVERAPAGRRALDSHRRLAVIYDKLGDPERAEQERALADVFEQGEPAQ
ncbi:MAG: O-antigen ligase family protein [Dehalococcoidia bacterium]|nr:O-antigen ligase family protein [Dehalococcoidia bacterium]